MKLLSKIMNFSSSLSPSATLRMNQGQGSRKISESKLFSSLPNSSLVAHVYEDMYAFPTRTLGTRNARTKFRHSREGGNPYGGQCPHCKLYRHTGEGRYPEKSLLCIELDAGLRRHDVLFPSLPNSSLVAHAEQKDSMHSQAEPGNEKKLLDTKWLRLRSADLYLGRIGGHVNDK